MLSVWTALGSALAIFSAAGDASAVAAELDVRARRGDAAPGTGGAIWRAFTSPTIDGQGRVAFLGFLEPGGDVDATNDRGSWGPLGSEPLALLMRTGDELPGLLSGRTVAEVSTPLLDPLGRAIWHAEDAVYDRLSLWRTTPAGGIELLLRDWDLAPPDFDETFTLYPGYAVIEDGGLALPAHVVARGGSVFRQDPSGTQLDLILRAQETIEGTVSGVEIGSITTHAISNASGEITGRGTLLVGVGGVTLSDWGIIYGPDGEGGVHVVARQNDPAPGLDGARHGLLHSPLIDDAGRVYFVSELVVGAGDTSESNDFSIWQADVDGSISLLLREGSPAPGYEPGAVLDGALFVTDTAPDGHLVVFGQVVRPGNVEERALWTGDALSGFARRVRAGDPAPGLPVPATFTNVQAGRFDPRGWLIFEAEVQAGPLHDTVFCGPGESGCYGDVLYGSTPEGELFPIFHRGQVIDVGSGEPVVLERWSYQPGNARRGMEAFAPDGRLAVTLQGSIPDPPYFRQAVAVVALPEPDSLTQLLALAGAFGLIALIEGARGKGRASSRRGLR